MTLLGQQEPPPPPPGPGVIPPFPAPPVEGRGMRIGLGLGLGALVLVLACGGGFAAFVGLTRVMGSALNEQADVVVGDYLDALDDGNYADAYDQLCDEAKATESKSAFTNRVSSGQKITDYEVGDVDMVRLVAPVDVTYADGDTAQLQAYLGPDSGAGGFRLCSIEE